MVFFLAPSRHDCQASETLYTVCTSSGMAQFLTGEMNVVSTLKIPTKPQCNSFRFFGLSSFLGLVQASPHPSTYPVDISKRERQLLNIPKIF